MPAEPAPPVDPVDEFYGGVWWVWDVPGRLRAARLGECATEIQRLRLENARLRDALERMGWMEFPSANQD
jgi:regulator of replication initiation timing